MERPITRLFGTVVAALPPADADQGLRTRFLGDLGQYSQQVGVLPPRHQAARVDTLSLTALLRLEQTQRQLPQPRQVLRAVPRPMPLVILAETNVQHPVQ